MWLDRKKVRKKSIACLQKKTHPPKLSTKRPELRAGSGVKERKQSVPAPELGLEGPRKSREKVDNKGRVSIQLFHDGNGDNCKDEASAPTDWGTGLSVPASHKEARTSTAAP